MTSKPPRLDESFKDRLKKLALWQWGAITIFSSLIVFMAMTAGRPTRRLNLQERAELYGVYAATVILLIAGVVMIVLHLVRRKKP